MTDLAHLWLFFIILLGVVVMPGLDMAYVLGSALTGGTRSGLSAVSGMVAAAVCHVTVATLGIGILIKVLPGAFRILLLTGAAYIVWIGISILRSERGFAAKTDTLRGKDHWAVFRGGMLTNLLNPKAYLFMLAIFPQFMRPEYGPLWIQGVVMWVIIVSCEVTVYGCVAVAAGRAKRLLTHDPATGRLVSRIVGIALILAGILAAVDGWTA